MFQLWKSVSWKYNPASTAAAVTVANQFPEPQNSRRSTGGICSITRPANPALVNSPKTTVSQTSPTQECVVYCISLIHDRMSALAVMRKVISKAITFDFPGKTFERTSISACKFDLKMIHLGSRAYLS